jgi:hypothetical protein
MLASECMVPKTKIRIVDKSVQQTKPHVECNQRKKNDAPKII